MLISTEHKLYQAHKCYNANNYWHLTTISMVKTMSESLKAKYVFSTFQFYEHFKFHAQVVHELEDLKVLRRSPDLLNNVKIGQIKYSL